MIFSYFSRKIAKLFAIIGDPDLKPHSVVSELGLHCLTITQTTMGQLKVIILHYYFLDGRISSVVLSSKPFIPIPTLVIKARTPTPSLPTTTPRSILISGYAE